MNKDKDPTIIVNDSDEQDTAQVAMSLNTRPRKVLDWQIPLEKFSQLVDYHSAFKSVTPHV